MSKLVVVNYRISDAEERETRRKIELLRRILERCAALSEELSRLEPVAGEDWTQTLAKYQKLVDDNRWGEFTPDYNRLYDALPDVEQKLVLALGEARAKRTRLELTAATLMALGASPEEKTVLDALESRSATLFADAYETAAARVEAILRKRLDTPLTEPDAAGLTSAQLALAAELLTGSGLSEPSQLPVPASIRERPSPDGARINKLIAQIGGLDTTLASFDDLLERLRQIPATEPAQRALLIDSIEIAASERLNEARRKREIRNTIDDGLASLAPFASLTADEHRRRLEAVLETDSLDSARSARDEAIKWAKDEAHRQDGARVRAALVAELQGLGYEVNVQAGAWNEGTSITAARPNEPNYDVQIGAAPGGKIQSKVRAYDHAGRSAGVNRRDVEVEQSWCDDLAKLNKLLAEQGIGSDILREDGPGTAAQVPLPARHDRGGEEPGRPIQRELK
jgi:hypothetical protein